MVMFDSKTGYLKCVLHDEGHLTNVRTAVAGAICAKYIAPTQIKGIGIIGANRAGIFLHLMPIFGAIMAMLIFDEKFMFYHILGAIFIIIGISLSNKKTKLN